MPERVVEFFVALLTKPGDLVLDPFGGSNTTGTVAERLRRPWVSIERKKEYVLGSVG
jgi:site-specific DNA-methyltransferase (cytosine-N4-specific)